MSESPIKKLDGEFASPLAIAIIGAGFSGLGMAIRLRQAGIENFALFEKAEDVGGTWRDNTYPGCACDVPSNLYSYSFAPKSDWSHTYARQPEIFSYLKECAAHYGLAPHLCFRKKLVSARYHDTDQRWELAFADGSRVHAQTVVSGMGGLHLPAIPDLPGLARFKGRAFHSAQWEHDFALRGKRVAVVGTGASAIQFIPKIAAKVASLTLFQRTAAWVLPRADRKISQAMKALNKALPISQKISRALQYSAHESRAVGFNLSPALLRGTQLLAKAFINKQIRSPELRSKLTPDYTMGCKRVLISNDYYRSLNRSNVDVVTSGIREVTATGVTDRDGVHYEVDVIIFATGFRVQDFIERDTFVGKHGLDILDSWPKGPEAYLGIAVAGFPNLFLLMGPNTGLGHNSMVYMIESQIQYVLTAITTMRKRRLGSLEVKGDIQEDFNRALRKKLKQTVWTKGGCLSWYVNEHGRNTTIWPDFTFRYRRRTKRLDVSEYHQRVSSDARFLKGDR
jgi:cation diffusion facilitator CzcD-associated flavoprotein CzcO